MRERECVCVCVLVLGCVGDVLVPILLYLGRQRCSVLGALSWEGLFWQSGIWECRVWRSTLQGWGMSGLEVPDGLQATGPRGATQQLLRGLGFRG